MSPERPSLRVPATDDDAGWATLAMGLEVELAPLHIARFLQAIANDGVMRRPTRDGATTPTQGGEDVRVMSAETAAQLREAMRQVVTDGTASDAGRTLRDARWSLGGKTGTIPSHRDGRQDGWFAGVLFDEARAPRYVVVVQVEGQGRGGGAAATLAAALTRAMGGVREVPPATGHSRRTT
jgi:cell division protein FtsI/penicillin-binding protein 2